MNVTEILKVVQTCLFGALGEKMIRATARCADEQRVLQTLKNMKENTPKEFGHFVKALQGRDDALATRLNSRWPNSFLEKARFLIKENRDGIRN